MYGLAKCSCGGFITPDEQGNPQCSNCSTITSFTITFPKNWFKPVNELNQQLIQNNGDITPKSLKDRVLNFFSNRKDDVQKVFKEHEPVKDWIPLVEHFHNYEIELPKGKNLKRFHVDGRYGVIKELMTLLNKSTTCIYLIHDTGVDYVYTVTPIILEAIEQDFNYIGLRTVIIQLNKDEFIQLTVI